MNHAIIIDRTDNSSRVSFGRRVLFVLKAWLRNPTDVATICPSSPFLTEHLANRDCVREAERIIELGPGAGGTTQALLDSMRPDAVLLAVEKTPDFAEALEAIIDPRLQFTIADASDLINIVLRHELGPVDVVVSGIPFSSLPESVAEKITQSIHKVLRPGGIFIAYQFRSNVKNYAGPLFGPASTELIPLNLPPLTAFAWAKACNPEQENHDGDNDSRSPQACIDQSGGNDPQATDYVK